MAWLVIPSPNTSTPTRFAGDWANKVSNMFTGVDVGETVTIHSNVVWSFMSDAFKIIASGDNTKKIKFNIDAIATATERTITWPNRDLTIGPTVVGKQDEFVRASDMIPSTTSGCSALTQVEETTGPNNLQFLDFDTTTEENAQFLWIPPRNWNAGTVKVRLIWSTYAGLATETVVWGVKAVALKNDATLDVAFGTEVTVTDTFLAQKDTHITDFTNAITIAGTPVVGNGVLFNIARKTGSDNLTGDARLIGAVIEYSLSDSVASA